MSNFVDEKGEYGNNFNNIMFALIFTSEWQNKKAYITRKSPK